MIRIYSSVPLPSLLLGVERWGTRSIVSRNVIGGRGYLGGSGASSASTAAVGRRCISLSRPMESDKDKKRRLLFRREISSSLLGSCARARCGFLLSSAGMGTGIWASSRSFPSASISVRTLATGSSDRGMAQAAGGEGGEGVGAGAAAELFPPDHLNDKERAIFEKLQQALEPLRLEVKDISGGCGSMYWIDITSHRFRGLTMLKQQRMVNEVLKDEVKSWHGMQLKTGVP